MSAKKSLIIVMPVYNEEAAIGSVLKKWTEKLDSISFENGYQIHVYNDGSRDRTGEILAGTAEKYPGKVIVHNKPNSGHGPTILQGYRENAPLAEWLFQIDSDDEMGPESFPEGSSAKNTISWSEQETAGNRLCLARSSLSFPVYVSGSFTAKEFGMSIRRTA